MSNDVWIPLAIGLVLVLGSIALAYLPNLPPLGRQAVRVLIAAGAGFLTYGLTGTIEIGGDKLGFTIKATMGFAVFIAVFFADLPARIARSRAAARGAHGDSTVSPPSDSP